MRIGNHVLHVTLLALVGLIAGCSSGGGGGGANPAFARSFGDVSTGSTKDQVRAQMGAPDGKRTGRVEPLRKEPPGAADLVQILPPNTPFEVWVYSRGETDYYIYFASGSNAPREQWTVVSRHTVPHSH